MNRSLIVLAAGALAIALVFNFLLPMNPIDIALKEDMGPVPPTEETTKSEFGPDLTRPNSIGLAAEVVESVKPAAESISVMASTASIEYVPGRFDAPEHLQVAVYGVVNETQLNYVAYVDDMKCDSGNCEIVIQIAGKTGISSKAAGLMSRINSRLEENPLTREIMVGVVSVSLGENGEGRVEFVTMLRPESEPSEN